MIMRAEAVQADQLAGIPAQPQRRVDRAGRHEAFQDFGCGLELHAIDCRPSHEERPPVWLDWRRRSDGTTGTTGNTANTGNAANAGKSTPAQMPFWHLGYFRYFR